MIASIRRKVIFVLAIFVSIVVLATSFAPAPAGAASLTAGSKELPAGTKKGQKTARNRAAVDEWLARQDSSDKAVEVKSAHDVRAQAVTPGATETFVPTGDWQHYVVPPGVTQLGVDAYGARGGGVGGGTGGRTRGIITVSPGDNLVVAAGVLGDFKPVVSFWDAWGWGGSFPGGGAPTSTGGGGGGGWSGVTRGGTWPEENPLIIAGAGGGMGMNPDGLALGGDGGGLEGTAGQGSYYPGGGAGTQTQGGVQTGPYAGNGGRNSGGTAILGAGGGGGGYYGGASGAADLGKPPSGGGGGSDFTDPSVTNVHHETGVVRTEGRVDFYTDLTAFNALTDIPPPPPEMVPAAAKFGGSNPSMYTNNCCVAQPVDTSTGNFFHTFNPISMASPVGTPVEIQETYNSGMASHDGPFGFGWQSNLGARLEFDAAGNVTVLQENGSQVSFTKNGTSFSAPSKVLATLTKTGTTYTLTRRAGEKLDFDSNGNLLREYGPSANVATGYGVTKYTYSTGGRLSQIIDPVGKSLTVNYAGNTNHVASIADPTGRTATFTYDSDGNQSSFTAVDGAKVTFTYDATHRMLTMLDPNQQGKNNAQPITNEYDAQGRVVRQIDFNGNPTDFWYSHEGTIIRDQERHFTLDEYGAGMLVRKTRALFALSQNKLEYEYDPATLGVTKTTLTSLSDPKTYVSTASYDNKGRVLSQTDPMGRTTSFTYNSFDEVLTTTSPNPSSIGPASVTATNTYDAKGNLLTQSQPLYTSGTAKTDQVTTLVRADTARPDLVTSVKSPLNKVTTFTYDAAGFQTQVSSPEGRITRTTYDPLGRVKTVVSPKGNVSGANAADFTTTISYDLAGRVLSTSTANGSSVLSTSNTYDSNGQIATRTDGANHTSTYEYWKDGHLFRFQRPDGSATYYQYFKNGLLDFERDGMLRKTLYEYDSMGRAIKRTDPRGRETKFTYNALDDVVTTTDAMNRVATTAYNLDGEPTSTTFSDGVTPGVTNTYNSAGSLVNQVDQTGNNTFAYDSLGRLKSKTDGKGNTVNSVFNIGNQETSVVYPGNKTVTRTFTNDGQVSTIADWLGHTNTFTYDKNGAKQTAALANGVTESDSYTNAGQLQQSSYKDPNGWDLGTYNSSYNAAGQVGNTTNTGYAADLGTGSSYAYDPLGRLTGADGTTNSYDDAENPTTLRNVSQHFSEAHELENSTARGGTTFDYNRVGQRTRQATTLGRNPINFEYDQAGRLTRAASDDVSAKYSDAVGADSPAAYYKLSGPNDDNAWDTTGNHHGFFSGSWKNGAPGALKNEDINGAVAFLSGQGQLWFDDVPANTGASQETQVEFFFKWDKDQEGAPEVPFTFRSFYGLAFNGGNFGFTTKADASDVYGVSDVGLENRWVHVVATFHNGDVTQNKLFIDGVQQTLSQKQGTPAAVNADTYASLSGNDNGEHHFDGTVDELAYYTSPLTAARIAAHAKSAQQVDASYTYFGDGLRATKQVGGKTNTFTWDADQQLLADGDYFYIYDPQGSPLEQVNATTGEVHYYQHDTLGSTTGLTDQNRFVTANFAYDAFGVLAKSRGFVDTPLKYRGESMDSDTGFVYLRHRYYDPDTAQFISVDPLVAVTRSAYGYANNSPLNFVDPSGLISWSDVGNFGKGLVYGLTMTGIDLRDACEAESAAFQVGDLAAFAGTFLIPGVGEANATAHIAVIGVRGARAVKEVRAADEALSTGEAMARVREAGRAGEKAAGIEKNTQRFRLGGDPLGPYRIPDQVANNRITEVKNVKNLSRTAQIRDFQQLADERGMTFEIRTRESTVLSGPLRREIEEGRIIHTTFPDF